MALSTRLTDTGLGIRTDIDALEVTDAAQTSQLAQTTEQLSAIVPYGAMLIVSQTSIPDYVPATKTFNFNSSVSLPCTLIYGNGLYYVVPNGTTVTHALATSAVKLIFTIATTTFAFVAYNTALTNGQVLVAAFRTLGDATSVVTANFPCTINGVLVPNYVNPVVSGNASIIAPLSGTLPNLDSVANTLTFYEDSMVLTRGAYYRLAADTVVDLTNSGTATSSAKKLYFRPSTLTFFVLNWNTNTALVSDIFIGSIRKNVSIIYISADFLYTVDGVLAYDKPAKNMPDACIIAVNHRGYSDAPENTLPAYILSKKKNFSYVECDVQFTSDGVPVLIHDTTIDRTSDGTGNVVDFTLAQLLTYDFGSWKSAAYTGTTIPTFEQFIITCKKLNLRPYVELKVAMSQAEVNLIIGIAKKYQILDKCSWFSFITANLTQVLTAAPSARIGLSFETVAETDIDNAETALTPATNTVFLLIQREYLTQSIYEYAIAADFQVEVWNITTSAHVITAAEMGVYGMFVDNLNVAQIMQA